MLEITSNTLLSNIDFRIAPFKKGAWKNYSHLDGLAHNRIWDIYQDPDGMMWFATEHGVSRFDGKTFVNLTAEDTEDGLIHNNVLTIYGDADGVMWFSVWEQGVYRYDGREVVHFTEASGLGSNRVTVIYQAPNGVMWFGTWDGGVSRYDGNQFVTFTEDDGLPHNKITGIHCDLNGAIWFGTSSQGVSRYDGQEFVNFTIKDSTSSGRFWDIYCDSEGVIWCATYGGIVRYDGKKFTLMTEDGLADIRVHAIHCDPDGTLWFGTTDGVSRYDGPSASKDGKEFTTFTNADGLAGNYVTVIFRDADGVLWVGTESGGVSGYDGTAWISLDTRDGLSNNRITSIQQDENGDLWFGTCGSLTRYRKNRTPPRAYIVAVTTDQRYTNLDELRPAIVGARITFEYSSIDFKTHPDKRIYRYRIVEAQDKTSLQDADWSKPTKKKQVDYTDLPIGEYIFQAQAIDRDLNYSEPATVEISVQPDPRDAVLATLQTELDSFRQQVGQKYHFEGIVGRSAPIKQARVLMERAIDSGLDVLITGDTGTGKELVAQAIYENSPRKNSPLQEINCGAIPKELIASELFGHRRGAFTGAAEDKIGIFEAASGGTLILDEIAEMSAEAQLHLLRALQERKIQRLGERRLRPVDVRVIAITNRDLVQP